MSNFNENVKDSDEVIISTNDEATQCKRFAIHKGYWVDPFIQYFSKIPSFKPPEINMGYFIRVQSMQSLIKHFLEVFKDDSQIINLGAGFDTTYWQLMKNGKNFRKYVEIDLPMVVYSKAHIISQKLELQQYFKNISELPSIKSPRHSTSSSHRGSVTSTDHEIYSQNYDLICGDLRDIKSLDHKFNLMHETLLPDVAISFNKPTLFLAECVLIYMESQETQDLLKYLAKKFTSALCFINYEQINMGDNFGSVMVDNLSQRGCALLGVNSCLNDESQKTRFLDAGWDSVQVESMLKLFDSLPPLEKHRILNIEFLDEKELLYQLLDHYCLCWACKNIDYTKYPIANTNIEEIIKN